jgi:hypothetical protein
VILDQRRLFTLATIVSKAKEFGEVFTRTSEFAAFVKDPSAAVAMLASQSGTLQGSAANAALAANIPGLQPGEQIGLELNQTELDSIATAGPRRTYHIEAYGEVERKQKTKDGKAVYPPIRKTVTGVWDMKVVPQNVRKPPAPKGAWVFMKED